MSTSTAGGTSTQTGKKSNKHHQQTGTSTNNEKSDELADDMKNIDDRGISLRFCFKFIFEVGILFFLVKLMQIKEINEEERQRLMESDEFLSFFTRNTRILEKALEQDDIFFEYGARDKNTE